MEKFSPYNVRYCELGAVDTLRDGCPDLAASPARSGGKYLATVGNGVIIDGVAGLDPVGGT